MTWRDDVVERDDAPVRAGWEVLDGLRSIAFTGAVEFPLLPAATVYFDQGRIYFAERVGDADVADRLVAAGAVRPHHLAAGVLVVGDPDHPVDHLGRLFDRVPSLDRERVMLALELLTEETTAWIARQSVGDTVNRPYDFHPSGVHHWYDPVPPRPAPLRPAVAAPHTGEPLPVRPLGRPHTPADLAGVRIEWPEPVQSAPPPVPPSPRSDEPNRWRAPEVPPPPAGTRRADESALDRFEIVWPSGDVGRLDPDGEPPRPAAPVSGDGLDRFEAPADGAELDLGLLADDASGEVALAVRRAIAAAEPGAATTGSPSLPNRADAPDPARRVDDPFTDAADDVPGIRGREVAPRSTPDDERPGGLPRWLGGKRSGR